VSCAHEILRGDVCAGCDVDVIKESYFVTAETPAGTDDEGVDWTDAAGPDWQAATAAVAAEVGPYASGATPSYPEHPDNPHNHRFTISLAPDKPPFIVVRGNTAQEITGAFNELEASGCYANLAAAWASLKAQGTIGAGLGPVSPVGPPAAPQAPAAPQFGAAPGPATPPPFGPNVSVPNAPGYQAPAQGGFPPPQQQGGWGGGQQRNEPKPRPQGWLVVDVPFPDKDRFKAMREASKDYFKGKVQWGGRGVYWLEPSVAQYVAQQGFPVTQ
jgi:hypothetical protein